MDATDQTPTTTRIPEPRDEAIASKPRLTDVALRELERWARSRPRERHRAERAARLKTVGSEPA